MKGIMLTILSNLILSYRISLQEDENKVLRQKLELCQKQKLEDMKLLQTLLRDVKTVSQQLIN